MVTEFICVSAFKVCILAIGVANGKLKCDYTTNTPALKLTSKEAAQQALKAFERSKAYKCERLDSSLSPSI
ncbi:MAG: hypothetical protein OXK80_06600 [Bdellovibrionales bacterium]|nr:hypothetical protein [Bdellovibrionales bacterium]